MTTLGGVFLASPKPTRLMDWFEALGFEVARQGEGGSIIIPHDGAVIVLGIHQARPGVKPSAAPLEAEPYGRQPMMCNLRVDDLDAAMEVIKGRGGRVEGPRDYEGMGRFAWTQTPDGHDVELWQP